MLDKLELIFDTQPYLCLLYQTFFSTAYFGLFRVGELASSPHVVKSHDVYVGKNKKKMRFILRTSKTHGRGKKPQITKIESQEQHTNQETKYCPFTMLHRFVLERRSCDDAIEQFFIFRDRSPLTIPQVRRVLQQLISMIRLEASNYGTHSFRAGRTVDLLRMHVKISDLKWIGRWASNAVYAYLSL